ncbi:MAG: VanZ family protein [Burkholderiaceae bacterium]|jgi:VanZ family protein
MTPAGKSNKLQRMSAPISSLPVTSPGHRKREAEASTTARIGLVFYLVLVIYASCYPWAGWRSNGLAPWSYLFEGLPHYWTAFDLVTNVVGYVPLGALIVFALYPRLSDAAAVLCTIASGVLLAVLLECVQSYLPSRVPSILDLITNTSGVLIGAIAGHRLSVPVLKQSRLRALKSYWFSARSSAGLIVVALWPLAQIYPQPYLFGHGLWLPTLSTMLSDWFNAPIDIGKLLWRDISVEIEHFLLAEIVVTALGMTAAVLTLLCQTRRTAPRAVLAIGLLLAATMTKALAHAVLFSPSDAFAWLTPSAASGLLVGAVMLAGLSFAPVAAQRRAAIVALLICLLLLNLLPSNPYFLATLSEWVQGKFLNFNGAAQFLSLFWPAFALWILLRPTHRQV